MRGLRFEAYERHSGSVNKQGHRIGQGKLYAKKQGYESKEYLLYKGVFKDNKFHGMGTLYYEESTIARYTGRFRSGLMHGRGTEFAPQGTPTNPIILYVGTFRNNEREGRGVEYFVDEGKSNGTLKYIGDFKASFKHGFGIQYLAQVIILQLYFLLLTLCLDLAYDTLTLTPNP